MDANEPREQGWTQFGDKPPAAGGFTRQEPAVMAPPPPPPPAPRKPGFTAGQKVIAGLALAAMAVGGGVAGAAIAGSVRPDTVVSAPSPTFKAASNPLTVADVAKKVQPSVVMIQGQAAGGSGVVLSEDGLILTNNHVVSGQGGQLTVKFSDGKTAKATIVGTDPATDLAVIRADSSGLTKAELGDSDQLKVGDAVLAVGSPLGLDGTVTAGIVSALDRTLNVGGEQERTPPGWPGQQQQAPEPTSIAGAIQTDAAINSGNSGGALVNAAGQLVGINTAIATAGSTGNIGVGFAIPVNTAEQVAEQLIAGGKVRHAFLGVSVSDASGDVSGALIGQLTENGPAAKAGLRQGDVITKIGDKTVDGGDTVSGLVRGFKPGQQVKITYMRDGRTAEVTVTLEERK
jgi:putative serine protease PepD